MPTVSVQELLRRLPGVDVLLRMQPIRDALVDHPRTLVLESIRRVLDAVRKHVLETAGAPDKTFIDIDHLIARILEDIQTSSDYTLRNTVNATGIVIHTNLGRSLLPEEAVDRLKLLCSGYNNLEYDLGLGRRGSRYVHAEAILRELTGTEAALVVNNNAAAVLLVLSTLARDREVVVSRGQLVEIGGSFRIPDVMRSSGAILREVGCTNRTHAADYESAINDRTALLMKVHTSNYRMVGFTSEVSLEDLVALGRSRGIPVVEDLGSGSFIDFSHFGLQGEPTVRQAVDAGADIVTFSGDKLLGGPQAGIILGRKDLVAQCRKNPLTRALRVDKMTLAALEATLRLYRDERSALERIPTLRMITVSAGVLEERSRFLASRIRESVDEKLLRMEVRRDASQVGGGSLPAQDLPTWVVAVQSPAMSTQKIELEMRRNRPPIIRRIESDLFILDVRTLREEDYEIVAAAFRTVFSEVAA